MLVALPIGSEAEVEEALLYSEDEGEVVVERLIANPIDIIKIVIGNKFMFILYGV